MMLTVNLDEVTAIHITPRGNIEETFAMPTTTSVFKRHNAAVEHFDSLGYNATKENTLVRKAKRCSAKYQVELEKFLSIAERV
jgi:hypothetical protein